MRQTVAKLLRKWTMGLGKQAYKNAKRHYNKFNHQQKHQLKKETQNHE